MSRLARFRTLAESRPNDAFAWYSLAMEERKSAPDGALHTFEKLRSDFPDYVPAYFQHATLLIEREQPEHARLIIGEGIEAARRAGDAHALAEISGLLDSIR